MATKPSTPLREDDEGLTHYQTFARSLKVAQAPFKGDMTRAAWSKEQLDLQNQQVPELIAAERAFVDAVCSSKRLREVVFRSFVEHVATHPKAGAMVRGFSRERNLVFVREVMPAFVRRQWWLLPSFAWSWGLVNFAWQFVRTDSPTWERLGRYCNGSRLLPAATLVKVQPELLTIMLRATERIARLRSDLVVTNMQLVVDRAMAFFRCTPQTLQSTEMDLISVATEGLLAGVDKVMIECQPAAHWAPSWHPVAGFAYWRGQSAEPPTTVGPGGIEIVRPFVMPEFTSSGYRIDGHHTAAKHVSKVERVECPASVFRTTAIGRMGGRLIQSYSQTHMHLGPDDKRLLYQANKVAAKHSETGTPDYQGMADHILRDRVSWTLAQRTGLEPRAVSEAIGEMFDQEQDWEVVGQRLSCVVETAPAIVAKARRRAPTAGAVSKVMLANSVVSVVDDEGEDRLNEVSSYSAPSDERPDRACEARSQINLLHRALEVLSILERKLLVLLGLAPVECMKFPLRGENI